MTGAITFTNQIIAEIPTVTIYTPDVPWIVQTGNNGLPNIIYPVFLGSVLAMIAIILKKMHR